MRCPHCGESVTPRQPMTRAQREVYAAMLALQWVGQRLTLPTVAIVTRRAESTTWGHIEGLVARGWLECGAPGRAPLADWTFTRPLDPDAAYMAQRMEAA